MNSDDRQFIKWGVLTQIATMAPLAAVVLCPPAVIPLAAVSAGIWKTYFKRTEHYTAG